MRADTMADRLVHGAVRIDLGNVNIRKLFAEEKQRCAIAKQVIPERRERRYANSEAGGAYAAHLAAFRPLTRPTTFS